MTKFEPPAPLDDPNSVCGTSLMIGEVQRVINHKLGTDAKITDWSAKDIGLGKGFVSVMAHIHLKWDSDNAKLPASVIAKIPTTTKLGVLFEHMPGMENVAEKLIDSLPDIHNCELSIFETFGKANPPPVQIPFCYGCKPITSLETLKANECSYILMEDLSDKGDVVNIMNCEMLNDKQIKQLLTNYANLHAWGLTHDLSTIKFLNAEKLFKDMEESFGKTMDAFPETLKSDQWKDRLAAIKDDAPKMKMDVTGLRNSLTLHKKYNIPDTISHGDVHTNNMLFERDEEGNATGDLMVLLDWQIASFNNPVNDIVRLFITNQGVTRRNAAYRLPYIKYYYQEFKEAMGDKPVSFTEKELIDCFEELYFTLARCSMPMMLGVIESIEAGRIPNVKDPKKSGETLLEDSIAWVKETVAAMKDLNLD